MASCHATAGLPVNHTTEGWVTVELHGNRMKLKPKQYQMLPPRNEKACSHQTRIQRHGH